MKKVILFILTSASIILSQTATKTLILKKTTQEIKIDGIIDDAWSQADSVSDFFQLDPYYAKPPTKRTVAKVLTTDDDLYCLMICYDDKKNIQQYTGMQDDQGGDIVSIMLDTFGDKRTAYKFAVTASGNRADCRLLDDARNRDYNYDGIWFSAAKVYDWGFVIEMKIPYKSLQYDKKLTEWGLDFDRWIPTISEDLYWNVYEKNEGQRISKFGKLIFKDFQPSVNGLNLEIYPVAIAKATYLHDDKYKFDPEAGIDIFYNPSQKLTFQATANPDFAQIEADPFNFNISRYESYFNERRPFFVQGNEVFAPSGKLRNTGFYKPMEFFYSRRIGKQLSDGKEVPLNFGTKTFGRFDDVEYGGFVARTSAVDYMIDDSAAYEPSAVFASARVKKQILGNSSVGLLYVGKYTPGNSYGVLDIDGAIRGDDWQLAYQGARSFNNSVGDYAAGFGFIKYGESWNNFVRGRYIGKDFDINQVGYVPWIGTGNLTTLSGPVWYPKEGYIKQIFPYAGIILDYKNDESYTDHQILLGFNMQLRDNWGYEFDCNFGKAKDEGIIYDAFELDFSSWFNINPKWDANVYSGYAKTYNFSRDYLAFYTWGGVSFDWKTTDYLTLGTSYDMFVEGNPDNEIEDITYNARPYFSLTPINDLNLRVYVDNVYTRSSDRMQRIILGALFSYQFSPKSWIYFAYNEIRNRDDQYDSFGDLMPNKMHVADRAAVLKVKYLYYF